MQMRRWLTMGVLERRSPAGRCVLCLCLSGTVLSNLAADRTAHLQTVAEQSGFQRTGRYDEVERLCLAYQRTWHARVRCVEFGRTPEGRPMLALIASADGTLDPATARHRRRPVIVIQGGIHAG